jgi:probable rRNA maturation factor
VTVLLNGPEARTGLPRVDRRLLRSRAVRILRELDQSRSELSIALVDDATIKDLNSRYRGRSRPTDVLAFALREGPDPDRSGNLLGDVVISLETAARQARRAHRGLDGEVARLLVHGTLHLLGHDHQKPTEARAMRAEERRLRRAIRS